MKLYVIDYNDDLKAIVMLVEVLAEFKNSEGDTFVAVENKALRFTDMRLKKEGTFLKESDANKALLKILNGDLKEMVYDFKNTKENNDREIKYISKRISNIEKSIIKAEKLVKGS